VGTWSVSLYGNDAAADVRGDLADLLRAPLDGNEIVAALRESYSSLDDEGDGDYCDLWLAIADQFHRYGLAAPEVMDIAERIISTGLDLDAKRALGMDPRSLGKREKLLRELRATWATPHASPRPRRVQAKPDAFVFEPGDCVAYPVSTSRRSINPYFAKAEDDPAWKPDGYGAMAVLTRGHRYRVFAWYAVARLSVWSRETPSLALCAGAMIESESSLLDERLGEKPRLAVGAGRLPPLFARKMRFETVGHLQPILDALRTDFGVFFDRPFVPSPSLANELSGIPGTRGPSTIPLSRYMVPTVQA
jgi:hypothetical protein